MEIGSSIHQKPGLRLFPYAKRRLKSSGRAHKFSRILTGIATRTMSEETRLRTTSEGLRDSFSALKETPSQETTRLYAFGPFRFDPAERKLLRGNQTVSLTPKAFDTLHLLVRNSGRVLGKDELLRMLWPDTFVKEGSLSNHIFLLRKALGEDLTFIETVPRRGYRFVETVRQFPRAAPTDREPAGTPLPLVLVPGKKTVSNRVN